MPQLPTYQAQVNPVGPIGQARASGQNQVADALGDFGNSLQNTSDVLYKRKEQREVSRLSAEMAKANAELSVQLKEELANADPNDAQFSERFVNERVNPRIAALASNASTEAGRQYIQEASARLGAQYTINTSAAQTELAGVAAQQNYTQTINNNSTAVATDPSNFTYALSQVDLATDTLIKAGSISRQQGESLRAKSRSDLAKTAARGWMDINPTRAKELIKSGQWDKYLDGLAKTQLLDQADNAIQAQQLEARRAATYAEQQAKKASDAEFRRLIPDILQNSVDVSELARNPALNQEDLRAAITMSERIMDRTDNIRDPSTYVSFRSRLFLPDNDPNKLDEKELNDAYAAQRINTEDYRSLKDIMTGKADPAQKENDTLFNDYLRNIKSTITKSGGLGIVDGPGDRRMQLYTLEAERKYRDGIQKGKDPRDLLNENSPDYIGKNLLSKYVIGSAEAIQNIGENIQGLSQVEGGTIAVDVYNARQGAAQPEISPRKPGESPEDYLKRIGK